MLEKSLINKRKRTVRGKIMKVKTKEKEAVLTLKNIFENTKNEITLSAILSCVYAEKLSKETVQTKVTNQWNAMEVSIHRINPKFVQKSKNYEKIKQEMISTLNNYETNLNGFCQICDAEIQELILKKVELEAKLLMAIVTKEYLTQKGQKESPIKDKNVIVHHFGAMIEKLKPKNRKQVDVSLINRIQDGKEVEKDIKRKMQYSEEFKSNLVYIRKLEKEIRMVSQKIKELNEQKVRKALDAMEAGDKMLSTQIRRPHTIKRITKFFANRFQTYHVIQKNVIEPIVYRIDEFKVNELNKIEIHNQEFDLEGVKREIETRQNQILQKIDNKVILKNVGILETKSRP